MIPTRRLILIKHSLPDVVPGVDAHRWHLSRDGRDRCSPLASRLSPYSPLLLATSREPKAQETAEIVGRALSLPVEPVDGLHEHDRTGVPWLSPEQWESAVRTFFDRPADRCFGNESANEALVRFRTAIESIFVRQPTGTIAVVVHGTVISLYVAALTGIEPFPLWQRLGLPSFVVLALPEGRIVEVVERV